MDERGIEDAIVMDQKTFKSLTSETRTGILKLLNKRNHTLSEVAETLGISKTTAKEHIDILVEGRLIEQVPSTNKWKYYTLTKDGRKLVGGEGPKKVVLVFGTFLAGMLLALYGFSGFMHFNPLEQNAAVSGEVQNERIMAAAYTEDMQAGGEAAGGEADGVLTAKALPEEEPLPQQESDYIPLVLGITGVAIMGMALLLFIRSRKQKAVI
ncbi:winged helix-turn-helix transcriptional regulator [Candidatus Micrarchaeota archaeon]|nr:winged helix-turn-helix transcriptional regulator [Candidatus Micrarchaeota archaeon]